jgi:hypothetical protein
VSRIDTTFDPDFAEAYKSVFGQDPAGTTSEAYDPDFAAAFTEVFGAPPASRATQPVITTEQLPPSPEALGLIDSLQSGNVLGQTLAQRPAQRVPTLGNVNPEFFQADPAEVQRSMEALAAAQDQPVQMALGMPLGTASDFVGSAAKGAAALPGQLASSAEAILRLAPVTDDITTGFGVTGRLADAAGQLAQFNNTITGMGLQAYQNRGVVPTPSADPTVLGSIGQGIPQMGYAALAGAGTGGLGFLPAVGVFAATSAAPIVGQTYQDASAELAQRGDLTPDEIQSKAAEEAAVAGTITLGTSMFPGAAILRRAPGGEALMRQAAGAVTRTLVAAGAEGAQEYAEGFGQEIAREMMRRDKNLTPEMVSQALTNPDRMMDFVGGAALGGAARAGIEPFAPSTQNEIQTPQRALLPRLSPEGNRAGSNPVQGFTPPDAGPTSASAPAGSPIPPVDMEGNPLPAIERNRPETFISPDQLSVTVQSAPPLATEVTPEFTPEVGSPVQSAGQLDSNPASVSNAADATQTPPRSPANAPQAEPVAASNAVPDDGLSQLAPAELRDLARANGVKIKRRELMEADLRAKGVTVTPQADPNVGDSEVTPQPEPLPEIEPRRFGESIIDALDRREAEILQRRRTRQIPRGRNTGSTIIFDEIGDVVQLAVIRATRAGVRVGQDIAEYVRAAAKDYNLPEAKMTEAMTAAQSLLDRSAQSMRAANPDLAADVPVSPDAVEQSIVQMRTEARAAAAKAKKPPTGINAQVKAFKAGEKAGKREAKRAVRAESEAKTERLLADLESELDAKALKQIIFERQKTRAAERQVLEQKDKRERAVKRANTKALRQVIIERETARADAEMVAEEQQGRDDVRAAVRDLVETAIPLRLRGSFIADVEKAETVSDIRDTLRKVQNVLASDTFRESVNEAERIVSRTDASKLAPDYKQQFETLAGRVAAMKSSAKIAKRWMVDEAQANAKSSGTSVAAATREALKRQTEALRTKATEAEDIAEKLTELVHRNKADRLVKLGNRIIERETLAKAIKDHLDTLPDLPLPKNSNGLETDYRAPIGTRILRLNYTPDTIAELIGGGDQGKVISRALQDGETKTFGDEYKASDWLKDTLETEHGLKWGGRELREMSAVAAGKDAKAHTIDFGGDKKIIATPAEWMALYATLTDMDAGAKIAAGAPIEFSRIPGRRFKLSPREIDRFLNGLMPQQWQTIADSMKQYIESESRPQLFDAFLRIKGYEPKAQRGYWRTKRDRLSDPLDTEMQTAGQVATRLAQNAGFLKGRVNDRVNPYVIGDVFKDFTDIIHDSSVVAHLAEPIHQARLLLKNDGVEQTIAKKLGRDVNRQIEEVLTQANLLLREPRTSGERVFSGLNRRYAKAVLSINPGTYLKQLGGVAKQAAVTYVRDMAHGIRDASSEDVTRLFKTSPYFRRRHDQAIHRRYVPTLDEPSDLLGTPSVADSVRGKANPVRKIDTLQERAFDRISLLDAFDSVASRVAIGSKLAEGRRIGLVGAELEIFAITEAERVIRLTNNTSSVMDMSGLAREHRGTAVSSLMMFTSDANKSANLLIQAALRKRGFGRALVAIASNNAIGAAVTAGMTAGLTRAVWEMIGVPEEERDKKNSTLVEAAALSFMRDSVGLVYGGGPLGEALTRAISRAVGRATFQSPIIEPSTLATINDLIQSAVQITGNATDRIAEVLSEEQKTIRQSARERMKQDDQLATASEKFVRSALKLRGIPLEPIIGIYNRVQRAVPEQASEKRKRELEYRRAMIEAKTE